MVSGEIVNSLVRGCSRWADAFRLGVIALACFGAHQISFLFPDTAKTLMAIWPAGGIGLAALLLCPRQVRRCGPWMAMSRCS
jgi:hypothetical protein